MFVVFFFHNKNNVFGLNFHHLLTVFLLPLQVYVLPCVFATFNLLSATSFVHCQIHSIKFFFFVFTQWLLFQ